MASFAVVGPLDLNVTSERYGRHVSPDNITQFWNSYEAHADAIGCYVFGFRASRGYKPFYVGKATKKFKTEIFTSHKLNKIHKALVQQKKGTLVVFFVALERTRGQVNNTAIDQVETYLIQAGLAANSNLLNDRKTKQESWSISGVFKSGSGKPSSSAKSLVKCLKL
jgi:hypothetical protein